MSQAEGALDEKHESWNGQQELGPELSGGGGIRAAVTTEGQPQAEGRQGARTAGEIDRTPSCHPHVKRRQDPAPPASCPVPLPEETSEAEKEHRPSPKAWRGVPARWGVSSPRWCFRCGHHRA